MGVTYRTVDPETGEPLLINIYQRKGKLVFRRLPLHLLPEYASARRLLHMAAFSSAAQSAYGSQGLVDGLPPAAAAVRTALAPESATGRRKPRRPSNRGRSDLRSQIPEGDFEQIKELAQLRSSFQVRALSTDPRRGERGCPVREDSELTDEDPPQGKSWAGNPL
jgi:hypothetical protein